jgi:uncharacterized lipoprotein YddW (UPF0748 family)
MKLCSAWVLIALMGIFALPLTNDGIATGATFANKKAILDGDVDLWTKREELDRRLERIKQAGFNVYMPAVWYGRGTTWPSRYAPWDFTLGSRVTGSYDPLRYAVAKAHELGLEVHPWFTLALRWNHSFMPQYGLEGVAEGPHAAFNVHNPSFREFMTNVVSEVATAYDIDGINLDFGRAMGLCSDLACQEEYRSMFSRNLLADSLMFKANPKMVPTLIEYQEKAVTALIKSISDSVRKSKPALVISADGHPELTRYEQGQNTIKWANEGLVDVVLGMDYRPVINGDAADRVRNKLTNPNALGILISNMAHGADLPPNRKPYSRSGKWLSDTIASISARWPNAGVAVYFYKYLSDEQVEALQTGPFKRSLIAPTELSVQ